MGRMVHGTNGLHVIRIVHGTNSEWYKKSRYPYGEPVGLTGIWGRNRQGVQTQSPRTGLRHAKRPLKLKKTCRFLDAQHKPQFASFSVF